MRVFVTHVEINKLHKNFDQFDAECRRKRFMENIILLRKYFILSYLRIWIEVSFNLI